MMPHEEPLLISDPAKVPNYRLEVSNIRKPRGLHPEWCATWVFTKW